MSHRITSGLALAALLLIAAGAAAAHDYPRYGAGHDWRAAPRGPTSTTLNGTLPQGLPMPRPGPYYTLPAPGARTDLHELSGRRYGTAESSPGSRAPPVVRPDDRRGYETDRDGVLRDRDGRRIEVLRPLPDGGW